MKDGKKGMSDNRMVKDAHQEGIGRVLQRKGEMPKGNGHCSGKMGSKGSESNWKRSDSAMPPRKA